jgi:predicted ester cyclase
VEKSEPVTALLDALNGRDLDAVASLLAPGFVFEEVAGSGDASRVALLAEIEMIFAGLSDVVFRPARVDRDGDRTYLEFRAMGTHSGEFLGVPPTGTLAVVSGVFNVTQDDHFIHSLRWTIDFGGLRRQLLMAAAPARRDS